MEKASPSSIFWLDFSDRLYTILRKENKAYRKLLLSAQKRHGALLKRDMKLLEELNQEDGTTVDGIKRYERDRAHLLKYSFSKSWPGYDGLSLKELIERMPPELTNHKKDFKEFRGEFYEVIQSLRGLGDAVNNDILYQACGANMDVSVAALSKAHAKRPLAPFIDILNEVITSIGNIPKSGKDSKGCRFRGLRWHL